MKVKTRIIDKSIKTPPLQYAKRGDAGIDLTATSIWYDENRNVCYGTNRSFEIPEGYVGLIFPRSSNAKKDLLLSNSVGVIDSGYRGEVMFKFKHIMPQMYNYKIGDKIGQIIIMPYPQIEFEEVDELSETDRGVGGFGSTGI
jgi:dUTP pyrophosphatase